MSGNRGPDLGLPARLVDGIRWRLVRIGIRVTCLVVIQEDPVPTEAVPATAPFAYRELTEADIDDLIDLEPSYDRARLLDWFGQGKLCFGLWDGPRLVAKTWCDLQQLNDDVLYRMLNPGEVYLFAAYSDPGYRGRNLAPMLRAACYATLRQRGATDFCSLSDYFNRPARRFKQKLGAIERSVVVQVRLKNGWSKKLTLARHR